MEVKGSDFTENKYLARTVSQMTAQSDEVLSLT